MNEIEKVPFIEAQAILAAQDGTFAQLDEILEKFLPGELQTLIIAAERLAKRARQKAGLW